MDTITTTYILQNDLTQMHIAGNVQFVSITQGGLARKLLVFIFIVLAICGFLLHPFHLKDTIRQCKDVLEVIARVYLRSLLQ